MIERKQPGSPLHIKAADYNAMADATERVLGVAPAGHIPQVGQWIAYARNSTAVDLPMYAVVTIASMAIEPADNASQFASQPVIQGDSPTTGEKWAMLLEPVKAGDVGKCFLAGVISCKIDKQNENDTHCHSETDATYLVGGSSGDAEIVWSESGTGEKWALIRYLGLAGSGIWGRLTEATPIDGEDGRWEYDFEQVEKTAVEYDGWTAVDPPVEGKCYNTIEHLETLVRVAPIPVGVVVWLYEVPVNSGKEYWFQESEAIARHNFLSHPHTDTIPADPETNPVTPGDLVIARPNPDYVSEETTPDLPEFVWDRYPLASEDGDRETTGWTAVDGSLLYVDYSKKHKHAYSTGQGQYKVAQHNADDRIHFDYVRMHG